MQPSMVRGLHLLRRLPPLMPLLGSEKGKWKLGLSGVVTDNYLVQSWYTVPQKGIMSFKEYSGLYIRDAGQEQVILTHLEIGW